MAFGVKYSKKFQRMGITTTYRVDILSEAGGGVITPDKMGSDPFQLKTLGSERDEDKIVIGSEITFEFVLLKRAGEANYDALFQSEYRDHIVKFYNDDTSTLLWQGYLQPENMYKSMFESNLHIYLSATDALKDLVEYSFLNSGVIITGHLSGLQILKYCLANLDQDSQFQYNFIVKLGTKHTGEGANDNALVDVTHDTRRFVNVVDGLPEVDDCLKVIEKILKPYSCTLQQFGGKYYILSRHEVATNYYTYNWALVFQSKAASNDAINIDAYKFQREADISYLSPIKECQLKLLNKNTGAPLVADINDYTAATGPWDYSNYTSGKDDSLAYMKLIAENDAGAPGVSNGYVTLASSVSIQKITDGDYLYLKFSYKHMSAGPANLYWPQFKVTVVKDGVDYEGIPKFIMNGDLNVYESTASVFFKLLGNVGETYNYNIKIEIITNDTVNDYEVRLDDFEFSRIFVSEGEDLSNVSFDVYYRAQSTKGKIRLPVQDFYFGDAGSAGDHAGLIYAAALTYEWDREGVNDNALLLYLWAKNLLTSRQDYTEYIVCVIKDSSDNITPVNYIEWDGKKYHIVSYDKSFRSSWIALHLKEWKTSDVTITWEMTALTSVNGEST
jgi:hypothetical protein